MWQIYIDVSGEVSASIFKVEELEEENLYSDKRKFD
jgi:hypothetical protein